MLNGEFFIPYEMICYWKYYKNKYRQYVQGESYKDTLKESTTLNLLKMKLWHLGWDKVFEI